MAEEIIIDGVDVSECVSFDKLNGQNICCYDDTREGKIPFANFCVENKDCYFKQHKRKEQECEKYKKGFEEDFAFNNELINDKLQIGLERNRYKQALEEIEKYIKRSSSYYIPYGAREVIQNIINKAKEKNNG